MLGVGFIMKNLSSLVAFGDSITGGYGVSEKDRWTAVLEGSLPGFGIHNAGVNGNTSREGLARFDKDVNPHLPAIVLVIFGGNDPINDPARKVDMYEFRENIRDIVCLVERSKGTCILGTFPPIINEQHFTSDDPYFTERGGLDAVVASYRAITREIAIEMRLPLFDLERGACRWMAQYGSDAIILDDGVHWTEFAHRLASLEIAGCVKGMLQ